jgi:hypothetical protein
MGVPPESVFLPPMSGPPWRPTTERFRLMSQLRQALKGASLFELANFIGWPSEGLTARQLLGLFTQDESLWKAPLLVTAGRKLTAMVDAGLFVNLTGGYYKASEPLEYKVTSPGRWYPCPSHPVFCRYPMAIRTLYRTKGMPDRKYYSVALDWKLGEASHSKYYRYLLQEDDRLVAEWDNVVHVLYLPQLIEGLP